jgi:hypothetical protein
VDIIELVVSLSGVFALVFALDASGKRYCLKKLKKAGAFSPEKAVTLEQAKIDGSDPFDRNMLRRLVKSGKVKTTEDGRFYIQH